MGIARVVFLRAALWSPRLRFLLAMNDGELDVLILGRLETRRSQDDEGEASGRTVSTADLSAFFHEPEARIQSRLRVLAAEGRIAESVAAPDRWMLVRAGDP